MTEKMPLADVERTLHALTLGSAPAYFPGIDRGRQDTYRRLVRSSLSTVIKNAIPLTLGRVGETAVDEVIGAFLAERPPTTRLYRDIPLGFAAWALDKSQSGASDVFPHAAFAELVHWEVAELDVLHAPDASAIDGVAHPDDDTRVVFDPSCRLLAYAHPVHRMRKGDAWPGRTKEVSFVLAHRQGERMKWMELTPTLTQLLAAAAEEIPIGDALARLDEVFGRAVDRGYCRSWLVNLRDRGALVGFVRFA